MELFVTQPEEFAKYRNFATAFPSLAQRFNFTTAPRPAGQLMELATSQKLATLWQRSLGSVLLMDSCLLGLFALLQRALALPAAFAPEHREHVLA